MNKNLVEVEVYRCCYGGLQFYFTHPKSLIEPKFSISAPNYYHCSLCNGCEESVFNACDLIGRYPLHIFECEEKDLESYETLNDFYVKWLEERK